MFKQQMMVCLTVFSCVFGAASAKADALDQWLGEQVPYSTRTLLGNIGPSAAVPEAAPGAVVASQSYEPFYRYHWIRDAALTMDVVVNLYERTGNASERAQYVDLLRNYVDFSRRNQLTSNPSGGADDLGIGEPKFMLDGKPYNAPWGRPQNDGPGLRASTLVHLARILLHEGHDEYVRNRLYGVVKADLAFVARHWRDSSYDLWEEVRGDHFYTRLVQRRGLIDGAELAERLGDIEAAQLYRAEAAALEPEISRHWDAHRDYIAVTLNQTAGLDYKSSGLDSAVVLAVLHASSRNGTKDSFFAVTDDRVLATATRLEQVFRQIYAINSQERNQEGQSLSPGIGRYPEDRYSGSGAQYGNPWFLSTNAFAELYYRCARAWERQGRVRVTPIRAAFFQELDIQGFTTDSAGEVLTKGDERFRAVLNGLREAGDRYLRRTRFHVDARGAMSEQFNRETGFMQSAAELTWSHASLITAAWERRK